MSHGADTVPISGRPIRIAVVGCGRISKNHFAAISEHRQSLQLVGVCDIVENRAREVAGACGTQPFKDYRDLLGKIDAASIAVPSTIHYPISKDFLLSGVNLMIEKPITTLLADADELLDIAKKKKLIVQVGHIERFNSAIRTVKNIVKVPRFIECHRLGPFNPRNTDVGVTLDLMIHDIDIVLDLIDSAVEHVDAVGAYILSQTEDIANARLRFKNRSVCNLTASRVSQDVQRRIRIFQDDAYISLDYVNQEALIFTKEGSHIHHRKIDITKSDSLREELSHFVECLHTKKRPLVSGEEGRNGLALALRIIQQIKDGQNGYHAP